MENFIKKIIPKQKNKSLPVLAVCRNCGTQLQSAYCHNCGQYLFSGIRRNVRDLVFSALENIFVLDNKLYSTLRCLFLHPGKLTQEYTNGRMVRYVHPSKLFWFITIVFFAMLTFLIKSHKNDKEAEKLKTTTSGLTINAFQDSTITISLLDESPVMPTTDKKDKPADYDSKVLKEEIKKININNTLSLYFPYVSFILIPFFAFLVFICFYKKEYFYVDYLAFSLHFHSFIFLLFAMYLGIHELWPEFKFHKTVFLLFPLLYFLRAIWVVYRPKAGALILKTFFIVSVYGITTVLITIIAFILLVLPYAEGIH